MKKTYIFLMLVSFNLLAQSGPVNTCIDCDLLTKRTEPFNGMWYNPDQSGTGFGIDVQNGKLFGAYYGYDETGEQIWLTYTGDLVPSDESGIMWTVEAELSQFENGNSFSEIYSEPNNTDYKGQINFKFTQKNHAIYSVNGGQQQNIVPIIFGVPATAFFPDQTSYKFPELAGVWAVTYTFNPEDPTINPRFYSPKTEAIVIPERYIDDGEPDQIQDIRYTLVSFASFPEFQLTGSLTCGVKEQNNELIGPSCEYSEYRGFLGEVLNRQKYKISVGGLGAFRIFGETDEGHTLEAIKINSNIYPFL